MRMKKKTSSSAPPRRRKVTGKLRKTRAAKLAHRRRIERAAHAAEARIADLVGQEDAVVAGERAQLASPDANGFDPAEYQWLPVRRRFREDGWTPQKQQEFIARLADTGCVDHACQDVQMSVSSAYRLRRSPGAEQFSSAWDVALQHASRKLLDCAFDRALRGTDEPVFDRDGRVCGRRYRQNDRLMMFLLRAYMPERFRHAHRDWRSSDETLPPAPPPMQEAIERIVPVPPEHPERLMTPGDLECAIQVADNMPPGELLHIHSGKRYDDPEAYNARQYEIDKILHPGTISHHHPDLQAPPNPEGYPDPWQRQRES